MSVKTYFLKLTLYNSDVSIRNTAYLRNNRYMLYLNPVALTNTLVTSDNIRFILNDFATISRYTLLYCYRALMRDNIL
jgi:hypothetical protein